LIAEGNSIPQIASLLCISKKTVEAHKTHIMEKLNIHDKVGLIKYAIRMVSPNSNARDWVMQKMA